MERAILKQGGETDKLPAPDLSCFSRAEVFSPALAREALDDGRRGEHTAARTEKMKMLAGQFYRTADPELMRERARARRIARQYAETDMEDQERRETLLRQLFGAMGEHVWIEPPFYCDYGTQIFLGDGVFMNINCIILDGARVTIGHNVLLAPGVHIYTASHPVEAALRVPSGGGTPPGMALPVTIGDNVWVGGGAIICPGVTIGENSTIGAGSVVTKDIPANVLAAGNPCRVLRRLE
jgi:maltose O-acetyltransferase